MRYVEKLIRLKFKPKSYEKVKALASYEKIPINRYLSEVLNKYLDGKYFPRGYKKGDR